VRPDPFIAAAALVAAFLLGSIPFGAILARLRGVDIQEHGSGNIGATNVARTLGRPLGVVVLLLDGAKGALPTYAGLALAPQLGPWASAATGLLAVLGHCYSPWLRFNGGKGVATALGVFVVVDPVAAAICVALFVLVYAVLRKASAGSLVGTSAMPVILYFKGASAPIIATAIATVVVILWRHRGNLSRLATGTEHDV
jgi:acyl phosphate:glycerol-3-phosphate acyltransferase